MRLRALFLLVPVERRRRSKSQTQEAQVGVAIIFGLFGEHKCRCICEAVVKINKQLEGVPQLSSQWQSDQFLSHFVITVEGAERCFQANFDAEGN